MSTDSSTKKKKIVLMPLSTLRYSSDPPLPPPPPTTPLAHQEHAQYNAALRGGGGGSGTSSRHGTPPPSATAAPLAAEAKVEKKPSGLFGRFAAAAKTAVTAAKTVTEDITVSAHRTLRDVSNSSDQDAFSTNFPTLAAQGSVLESTHNCAALSGGLLVYGTLFVSSTSLCFLGAKHRDAVPLMEIASYLPSVSFEVDLTSPEGKRTIALARAQQTAIGSTITEQTPVDVSASSPCPPPPAAGSLHESASNFTVSSKGTVVVPPSPPSPSPSSADVPLPSGVIAPYILPCPAPNVVPTCLQIFTQSGQLYQFVDFTEGRLHSVANIGVRQTSCQRACRYMDESWRKAMAAHNRAALKDFIGGAAHPGVGGGGLDSSTTSVETGKMVDQRYCLPHDGVGVAVGP